MSIADTPDKAAVAPPRKKKKKSARKRLYEWHTWVGFHLSLIMVIVLFTGTVATVSNEIDWLAQHDMRVSPQGERVSWQTMHDSVSAYASDAYIGGLSSMDGDHFAYRADVTWPSGARSYVHVNQWTGEVTGTTHPLTVQRIFRDLHRYLFMPSIFGLPIVTSMAFILAISLYTGLKTTRNWTTLMARVRFSKGTRIAVGDAHKAAGLWGSWFFIVMIGTGIWYLAEFGAALGGQRFEPSRPSLTAERVADFGDSVTVRSVDEIIAAAQESYPELEVTSIRWPSSLRQAVTVAGDVGNPIIRDRSNAVFLDPVSLEVLQRKKSDEMGWIAWLNETADPLHFGFFGGLPTKLIWFVFGVAMTGLSVTGVWLTWKRLKSNAVSRAQFATFPVVFFSVLAAYFYLERYKAPYLPGQEVHLTAISDGALTLQPALEVMEDSNHSGFVRLSIRAESGVPNVRSVAFDLGEDPSTDPGSQQMYRVRTTAMASEARARFNRNDIAGARALRATVTLNSGRTITQQWPLDERL
ncbi:MAG: PepSY-associated TM helix domain-containing protein [Pseudomonadota bacterium]